MCARYGHRAQCITQCATHTHTRTHMSSAQIDFVRHSWISIIPAYFQTNMDSTQCRQNIKMQSNVTHLTVIYSSSNAHFTLARHSRAAASHSFHLYRLKIVSKLITFKAIPPFCTHAHSHRSGQNRCTLFECGVVFVARTSDHWFHHSNYLADI